MKFKLLFRKAIPFILAVLLMSCAVLHPAIADDEVTNQPVIESTDQSLTDEPLPADSTRGDLTQGDQNGDSVTPEELQQPEPTPVPESPPLLLKNLS